MVVGFERTVLNVSENAGKVEICVNISQPSNAPIEIHSFNLTVKTQAGTAGQHKYESCVDISKINHAFALSSDLQDFQPIYQSLEGFGNSVRRQCVNVTITDNDVREDAETFTVTLERPSNRSLPKILIRPAMVTVTILDNDGKDITPQDCSTTPLSPPSSSLPPKLIGCLAYSKSSCIVLASEMMLMKSWGWAYC